MPKIAITTTSFGEYDELPLALCRQDGYEVILNPYKRKIKSDELLKLAGDAIGIIAGTESLDKEVLRQLKNVKVISRCGAGLDNVDLAAAEKLGIKVTNTPDAPTQAVAELTIGLILNLLRKVCREDGAIRSGRWDKMMGNLLSGKKAGVIGYGRIGRRVSGLLKALGCDVAYFDPAVEDPDGIARKMSKEDLLGWAQIVTIHAATKDVILGPKEFGLINKDSWIVNVSRGEAVDEKSLYDNLVSGRLAGAALDVFCREPYDGPMKGLDNVILTPHIGSYAKEARINMEKEAVENLLKGLRERA